MPSLRTDLLFRPRQFAERVLYSTAASVGLSVVGLAAIAAGICKAFAPVDQVMLVVKGEWLAAEARQARQLECGMWIGGGVGLILAAALVRGLKTLRVSERWNRLVLGGTLAAVATTDEQGIIHDWNPRAEKVFGYTAAEARGHTLTELLVPGGSGTTNAPRFTPEETPGDTSLRGGGELLLVAKDGKPVNAQIAVTAMRLGKHSRNCVFLYDITEYKQTQAQLAHAQKLESIGQLAAGIAHEINTPAQYVGDNVRFLKEQFAGLMSVISEYARRIDKSEPPMTWDHRRDKVEQALAAVDFEFLKDEIPKAIDQSIEGLDRVTAIVRAMKDFSHPGSDHKEAADLNRSIASTIEVCRNRWKFVATLTTDFAPDLPTVPCLVAEFNQVILNLIVNAADAIGEHATPDGGPRGHIHVSTAVKKTVRGDVAEIRIRDDGPGIPESVRRRIFEPFFTTKPVGKGTGQGLTISRSVIVQKHGGELSFEQNDGPGTTFVIRLPVAEDSGVETGRQLSEAA
jgi:PAS domain S-box-containing protein